MEQIEKKKSLQKGILFSVIVLLGNAFYLIINDMRPADMNVYFFAWMSVIWEIFCVLPILILESRKSKSKHEKSEKNKQEFTKTNIILRLLIVGICFSIAAVALYVGLTNAGSIAGSIALKTSPIYTMFLGAWMLNEKVTLSQLLITLGMFVVLIYMGTAGTFQLGQFSWGVGVLMLVPLLWGIGHALSKPILRAKIVTSPQLILIRNGLCTIFIGIPYLIIYGVHDFWQWTSPVHLCFMFLIGINNMLMHWGWYRAITEIDLSLSSALVMPSPLVTTLIAVVFLKEPFYYYHAIGLIGSMIGLYLLIIVENKKIIAKRKKESATKKQG